MSTTRPERKGKRMTETEDQTADRQCAWADYRKDYGVDADEMVTLRAKVAAVEARLDRLDRDVQSIASASDYGMGYQDGQSDERAYISREIRAALAVTTGEGE